MKCYYCEREGITAHHSGRAMYMLCAEHWIGPGRWIMPEHWIGPGRWIMPEQRIGGLKHDSVWLDEGTTAPAKCATCGAHLSVVGQRHIVLDGTLGQWVHVCDACKSQRDVKAVTKISHTPTSGELNPTPLEDDASEPAQHAPTKCSKCGTEFTGLEFTFLVGEDYFCGACAMKEDVKARIRSITHGPEGIVTSGELNPIPLEDGARRFRNEPPTTVRVEADPHGIDQHAPGAKLDAGKLKAALVMGDFANALTEVIRVGTFGANKYTDHGWLHVDDGINRYTDAMQRHYLKEIVEGATDDDSGITHAGHLAWNALARLELMLRDAAKEKK